MATWMPALLLSGEDRRAAFLTDPVLVRKSTGGAYRRMPRAAVDLSDPELVVHAGPQELPRVAGSQLSDVLWARVLLPLPSSIGSGDDFVRVLVVPDEFKALENGLDSTITISTYTKLKAEMLAEARFFQGETLAPQNTNPWVTVDGSFGSGADGDASAPALVTAGVNPVLGRLTLSRRAVLVQPLMSDYQLVLRNGPSNSLKWSAFSKDRMVVRFHAQDPRSRNDPVHHDDFPALTARFVMTDGAQVLAQRWLANCVEFDTGLRQILFGAGDGVALDARRSAIKLGNSLSIKDFSWFAAPLYNASPSKSRDAGKGRNVGTFAAPSVTTCNVYDIMWWFRFGWVVESTETVEAENAPERE